MYPLCMAWSTLGRSSYSRWLRDPYCWKWTLVLCSILVGELQFRDHPCVPGRAEGDFRSPFFLGSIENLGSVGAQQRAQQRLIQKPRHRNFHHGRAHIQPLLNLGRQASRQIPEHRIQPQLPVF